MNVKYRVLENDLLMLQKNQMFVQICLWYLCMCPTNPNTFSAKGNNYVKLGAIWLK